MYELKVQDHFDAAHRLLKYAGKCSRLHGHTWTVIACVKVGKKGALGISLDFSLLKEELKKIVDEFDHKVLLSEEDPLLYHLNLQDVVLMKPNPTAEVIAESIHESLLRALHELDIEELTVTVREGVNNECTYNPQRC